ncbi:proteoglycan 3-like [Sorex fumeus]|uniref:proteoglycan 3-like n=1 Tax=Sorex fumeus TaxID=62283 RepID=UPI0024AE0A7A|nr:proteoglycan 3-like [Sorex fumeus]
MKLPLLLPLLLGTVSARHLGDNAPPPECLDNQADLSQKLDYSEEQRGVLALHGEEIPSGEEEAEASGCQETFEDEDNLDSDPAAPEDIECPKEEEAVQLQGTPECKTCRYVLVRKPQAFWEAQKTCSKLYQGNLVSIHNLNTNNQLRYLATGINQGQVWIGATRRHWILSRKFKWTDESYWNFTHWAPGEPGNGGGRCVFMCIKGGLWKRAHCTKLLPFICSA